MNPIEQLKSVLCDPEGKCCIDGSDEDRAVVDKALQALAQPEQEPVAGLTPSGYFIKGWDARGIHEKTSGSVESDRAMRHYMLGITDTTPPQRKPLTAANALKLKDAFYAGFDAYDTPAAPCSDVDEKWAEYKAAHGIRPTDFKE